MANKDQKKNIALHPETYKNLSTLAAQLRIDNGGKFVSMSEAVGVLLDKWEQGNQLKTHEDKSGVLEQISQKNETA